MKNLKVSAIICAAGKGERAGFKKNKLLAPLYGAPALYYTLKKFCLPEIDEVIVTSSETDFEEISALCAPLHFKTVEGGKTRGESVKRALEHVNGDIVLIHDGARPFLSKGLILNCIESVKKYGSGICALPVTDTVAFSSLGTVSGALDRNSLCLLQTPQGFFTQDIKSAYALCGDKTYTDDSAVYREYIGAPKIIEGERQNVKLTFGEDFERQPKFYSASDFNRVGFGADVHAFGDGNEVTLAGVKIACDKRLIAHSDGDVVIHSVMDALLSAAGLKDIGHYFPDTDESLKGADSAKMLEKVVALLKDKGFKAVNLSISVQAEKPRLAPHIDKMIDNLSAYTGVERQNIAVSAGTCEGLGFVGEGLGVASYCYALVRQG